MAVSSATIPIWAAPRRARDVSANRSGSRDSRQSPPTRPLTAPVGRPDGRGSSSRPYA
jgi:hypothetical protein